MARKPTKTKTRKAPTPKPVSPELPADDDEERLSDGRHLDELYHMRDRLFGLAAAIECVCDSHVPYEAGLNQLASDVADAMGACTEAFEAETALRKTPEQREWQRKAEERLAAWKNLSG
jgi:hypothetical protein